MPRNTSLRALGMAALSAMAAVVVGTPGPVAASVVLPTTTTAAQRVIAVAESKLGHPYAYGSEGPYTFDCSGLVIYSFRAVGAGGMLGGGRTAQSMYAWYLTRGLASRSNPALGDLAIYGAGSHVGIYIGGGRIVSALLGGVANTSVFALTTPFTAYLHTGLTGVTAALASTAGPAAIRPPTAGVSAWRRTSTALRLRAAASTRSRILATLGAGTRVGIIGSTRAGGRLWYHVRVGFRVGWIAAAFTR